jgi:hypothetical protein
MELFIESPIIAIRTKNGFPYEYAIDLICCLISSMISGMGFPHFSKVAYGLLASMDGPQKVDGRYCNLIAVQALMRTPNQAEEKS